MNRLLLANVIPIVLKQGLSNVIILAWVEGHLLNSNHREEIRNLKNVRHLGSTKSSLDRDGCRENSDCIQGIGH
jgi:hypothetical protein